MRNQQLNNIFKTAWGTDCLFDAKLATRQGVQDNKEDATKLISINVIILLTLIDTFI
jgi:hypothetical protein